MAAVFEQYPEDSEQLQLHTLERTLRALCEHVAKLVDDASVCKALDAREASFQLQAFEERRDKALQFLSAAHCEPCWMQIGHLGQLLDALDCSREFFATKASAASGNAISAHESVLVR